LLLRHSIINQNRYDNSFVMSDSHIFFCIRCLNYGQNGVDEWVFSKLECSIFYDDTIMRLYNFNITTNENYYNNVISLNNISRLEERMYDSKYEFIINTISGKGLSYNINKKEKEKLDMLRTFYTTICNAYTFN
jgi:hypothetical protein